MRLLSSSCCISGLVINGSSNVTGRSRAQRAEEKMGDSSGSTGAVGTLDQQRGGGWHLMCRGRSSRQAVCRAPHCSSSKRFGCEAKSRPAAAPPPSSTALGTSWLGSCSWVARQAIRCAHSVRGACLRAGSCRRANTGRAADSPVLCQSVAHTRATVWCNDVSGER